MKTAALAVVMLCLPGAMCTTAQSRFPNRTDVEALVKRRPKIPPEALDPANVNAATRYQDDKRSWEDELIAAGVRVCRYLSRSGMEVSCEG